ncbi:MAG: amino acid ABC transporter permease [Clostridia bacterium]
MEAIKAWALSIWEQFDFNIIQGDRYKMLLDGLGVTLTVALFAALIGVVLGFLVALMRISQVKIGKWYFLRWISSIYVDVIRGTPVVVQLMIMYFIILLPFKGVTQVQAAILCFGINSAAYVSEMVRGGILSVDKGQTEAGRSLGLTSGMTMRLIVMPQTLKIIMPSLFNEFIALLKETSVVGYIGLMDLAKAGDYIKSRTYSAFFPLLMVAAIYLVIVIGLTRLFGRLERRMRQSDLR